jgi:hypothetical protein
MHDLTIPLIKSLDLRPSVTVYGDEITWPWPSLRGRLIATYVKVTNGEASFRYSDLEKATAR